MDYYVIYFLHLYNSIPKELYEFFLAILCIGCIVVVLKRDAKQSWRAITCLLLIEYVLIIYYSTVFHRDVTEERQFNFLPFWSYRVIHDTGTKVLLAENIMNFIVFIPIGLLLALSFKQITWWKVLIVGTGISFTIEILQFWLMRGFSEVDDVMHNTLGCILGYVIVKGLRHLTV